MATTHRVTLTKGMFRRGLEHYEIFDEKKGCMLRRIFCKNSRVDKVFHLLKKKGLGLEIGPSHNPTAPKSKGLNIHILDLASAADIRSKYQGHGVNLNNIEEVHLSGKANHFMSSLETQVAMTGLLLVTLLNMYQI